LATPVWTDLIVPEGAVQDYTSNNDNFIAAALLMGGDGETAAAVPPRLINHGQIHLVSPGSTDNVALFYFSGMLDWSKTPIENYGTISAILPNNWGAGLIGGPRVPDLYNSGTLEVQSRYHTTVYSGGSEAVTVTNTATGVISATAGVNAYALYFYNGNGTVINDGQILVHLSAETLPGDPRWPVAIWEGNGAGAGVHVTNTGLIQSTDEVPNTDLSIGIFLHGDGAGSIVNSGTISGDWAIREFLYDAANLPYDFQGVTVVNSGMLTGKVELDPGRDVILNSGTINGTVSLGLSSDVYDGTGGVQTGAVSGGDGADLLIGTGSADSLNGGAGRDVLFGAAGDALSGGAGGDTFVFTSATNGQAPATITDFVTGTDVIDLRRFAPSNVTIDGSTITATGASGTLVINVTGSVSASDIITAGNAANGTAADDVLIAGAAAAQLSGGDGNDLLIGSGGADTLDGGAGFDVMYGGSGDDVYLLDSGTDNVVETSSGGFDEVQVQAAVWYTLPTNVEKLTITGSFAIGGWGNELDNVITGNAASNVLAEAPATTSFMAASATAPTRSTAGPAPTRSSAASATTAISSTSRVTSSPSLPARARTWRSCGRATRSAPGSVSR